MIVTRSGAIPEALAEAARASLDDEVARRRAEGALEAGQRSSVKLEWTTQTAAVVQAFEKTVDVQTIQSLGVTLRNNAIKWAGPIVYIDVLPEPMRFPSSALGYGIIGILALGPLQLPEIGESGPIQIETGSVAYFRDSSPVVYRACGGGRGILFYIS